MLAYNKAHSGRVGIGAFFKHFPRFVFFCIRAESTPAHTSLTQTVRPFYQVRYTVFRRLYILSDKLNMIIGDIE